jgi:hypothetical protein
MVVYQYFYQLHKLCHNLKLQNYHGSQKTLKEVLMDYLKVLHQHFLVQPYKNNKDLNEECWCLGKIHRMGAS